MERAVAALHDAEERTNLEQARVDASVEIDCPNGEHAAADELANELQASLDERDGKLAELSQRFRDQTELLDEACPEAEGEAAAADLRDERELVEPGRRTRAAACREPGRAG